MSVRTTFARFPNRSSWRPASALIAGEASTAVSCTPGIASSTTCDMLPSPEPMSSTVLGERWRRASTVHRTSSSYLGTSWRILVA